MNNILLATCCFGSVYLFSVSTRNMNELLLNINKKNVRNLTPLIIFNSAHLFMSGYVLYKLYFNVMFSHI